MLSPERVCYLVDDLITLPWVGIKCSQNKRRDPESDRDIQFNCHHNGIFNNKSRRRNDGQQRIRAGTEGLESPSWSPNSSRKKNKEKTCPRVNIKKLLVIYVPLQSGSYFPAGLLLRHKEIQQTFPCPETSEDICTLLCSATGLFWALFGTFLFVSCSIISK